jgi:hypothetical protein
LGPGSLALPVARPCDEDAFVARLDSTGRAVWAKQFGDREARTVDGIAMSNGNLAVVTESRDVECFGGKSLADWYRAAHAPAQAPPHLYLAELTPSGKHVFSEQLEIANPVGYVVEGPAGEVLVAGQRGQDGYVAAYCP